MRKKLNSFVGVIICVVTAVISMAVGSRIKSVGAAGIAITLGILLGNTLLKDQRYIRGIKFSEKNILSMGIAFMGAGMSFSNLNVVGIRGISFVLLQMGITIAGVIFIGRRFMFKEDFVLMMAAGNAVCGSSAIATAYPLVGEEEESKGLAVAIVNLTGTILMFLLPITAGIIYSGDVQSSGKLIGGVLQSVGQVAAAGSIMGEEIASTALVYKMIRVILLSAVVVVLGNISSRDPVKSMEKRKSIPWRKFVPWYIVLFFILMSMFSIGIISSGISSSIKEIGTFFEVTGLAAIGMRISISAIMKQGPKALLFGLLVGALQCISAIALIKMF